MTDIRERQRQDDAVARRAGLIFGLAMTAPITAIVAMGGFRLGWWSYGVAWNGLTLGVALPLFVLGFLGALYALGLAVKSPKSAGLPALAALVVSATGLGLFAWLLMFQASDAAPDVSTNPSDPPAFPAQMIAAGAPAGPPPQEGACEVEAYLSQSAPGAAGYALQKAGFTIGGVGVGRAVGTQSGAWFGSTWDAVVRIRPGRTDIRVAAREPARDRGDACRMAQRIAEALRP